MEKKKHLYIVSFADSEKYRLECFSDEEDYALAHVNPVEKIEKEIKEYLQKEFPGKPLAYYENAKVVEINPEHSEQYENYPLLDNEALKKIEANLTKEIQERAAVNELNSDAPFSNV